MSESIFFEKLRIASDTLDTRDSLKTPIPARSTPTPPLILIHHSSSIPQANQASQTAHSHTARYHHNHIHRNRCIAPHIFCPVPFLPPSAVSPSHSYPANAITLIRRRVNSGHMQSHGIYLQVSDHPSLINPRPIFGQGMHVRSDSKGDRTGIERIAMERMSWKTATRDWRKAGIYGHSMGKGRGDIAMR
eukprot:scaffold60862_cov41-Cyclotella_meneghiniana.AAC.1